MQNDIQIDDISLDSLSPLGAGPAVIAAWKAEARGGGGLARVISSRRDRWLVAGILGAAGDGIEGFESGKDRGIALPTALAAAGGRLIESGAFPVTGDWVALRSGSAEAGLPLIEAILPRSSLFSRKAAGPTSEAQAIAANVDTALCVMAAGYDFNLRRLERYLSLAWDSGARPIIVISKIDLAEDGDALEGEIDSIAFGVPRVFCSSRTGKGLEELAALLAPGSSSVLLGSSGCGKSSLLNALSGRPLMETQAISGAVGKGRHTTTGRELFALPSGALIIDTPGMRELGVNCSGESVGAVFPEIEALVASCRFSDCSHGAEPGCALRAAIEAGQVDRDRLSSWMKLQREAAFERRRSDAAEARAHEARWKAIAKSHRGSKGHDWKTKKHGL